MRRLAVFLILAACAPADHAGSVQAWLFSRDPVTSRYALSVGAVDNLASLRELRGRDVEIRRNTSIVETLAQETEIDQGGPFSLEYTEDPGGVIIPGDLNSFHALTLYANLDRVASLLRKHGHEPTTAGKPLLVYFLPRYDNPVLGDARLLFTDNAAFFSAGRGFLIVPSFVLSELPMLLNEGVIAHEFGHSVVHREMFGDVEQEPFASETAQPFVVLRRHLQSMHEGVADIVGFVATGDPNFILPTADVDRDMSVPRSMAPADLALIEKTDPPDQLLGVSDFDPHHQGSLLARAVFEAWPKDATGKVSAEDRSRLLTQTLVALGALSYDVETFTFASFADELAAQLPRAERAAACDVFKRRLAPLYARMPNCVAVNP